MNTIPSPSDGLMETLIGKTTVKCNMSLHDMAGKLCKEQRGYISPGSGFRHILCAFGKIWQTSLERKEVLRKRINLRKNKNGKGGFCILSEQKKNDLIDLRKRTNETKEFLECVDVT